MMDQEIHDYAERHSSDEPTLLSKIRRETYLRTVYPQMLSGPLQGRLLAMISKLVNPLQILEIGTFTGYSALCLCEGLAPEGMLHTIESNPEMALMARGYFGEAGEEHRIKLHEGEAMDILPSLEGPFDLVFVDAAKEQYIDYFRMIIDKMRPGGIILVDNVLWGGKVLDERHSKDKETQGIIDFNRHVRKDGRVETVLLPLRDGISLIRVVRHQA